MKKVIDITINNKEDIAIVNALLAYMEIAADMINGYIYTIGNIDYIVNITYNVPCVGFNSDENDEMREECLAYDEEMREMREMYETSEE